jgi:hypothetical protein
MKRIVLTLALLLSALLLCLGCTSSVARSVTVDPPPAVTKVLVFVEENHSLAQMETGMPYTFSLAQQYGYADNYSAITHPSLPNYLALSGGSTFGISDDADPGSHPLSGLSVFNQVPDTKVYADSMPSKCYLSNSGNYAVRHNPWTYYTSGRTKCSNRDYPFGRFSTDVTNGALPTVGWVVPNLCHDAHNCSLATADAWFKTQMAKILAGPDWASGHLAVVLTADEDDRQSGNKVLTVVIHPSQSGNVVSAPLTHYSLLAFTEDVGHVSHLRNASTAPSLSQAFGIPVG